MKVIKPNDDNASRKVRMGDKIDSRIRNPLLCPFELRELPDKTKSFARIVKTVFTKNTAFDTYCMRCTDRMAQKTETWQGLAAGTAFKI
jgi:hypothetical protein